MCNEKKIRIFYWGIDNIPLLKSVCEKKHNEGKLEICVCVPMGTSDTIGYDTDYFRVVNTYSIDENKLEILDYDTSMPVDGDLLEKMLPYESRAIELGMRRTNVPIVEYTREQQRYYRELRRIKNLFADYRINAYFASAVPHYQDGYIAYCLACISNMPTFFFAPTGALPNRRLLATKLGDIGESISQEYKRLCGSEEQCSIRSHDIEEYYKTQSLPAKELLKIKSPGNDNETRFFFYRQKKLYWGVWSFRHQLIWNPITRYCKRFVELKRKRGTLKLHNTGLIFRNFVEEHALVNYYMRHYRYPLKAYNKMAQMPDYKKPFILFALQFVPEASTIPEAGVFSSQYVSIQLLSKIAEEFDVDIYVKEHGHLAMRNNHFYDEIKLVPNIKFISSYVSTYELMRNSIAVASQTGTIHLEAVLQGIPAIAMGNGYLWKSLPGLFEIKNYEEGRSIIKSIIDGKVSISKENVYKYMCAIDKKTLLYKAHEYFRVNDVNEAEFRNNIEVINEILDRIYDRL